MSDVQVRIREITDADGQVLCNWPLDDLERLVHELSDWGVLGSGDVTQEVVGQFKLRPVPHFEVIVGSDE